MRGKQQTTGRHPQCAEGGRGEMKGLWFRHHHLVHHRHHHSDPLLPPADKSSLTYLYQGTNILGHLPHLHPTHLPLLPHLHRYHLAQPQDSVETTSSVACKLQMDTHQKELQGIGPDVIPQDFSRFFQSTVCWEPAKETRWLFQPSLPTAIGLHWVALGQVLTATHHWAALVNVGLHSPFLPSTRYLFLLLLSLLSLPSQLLCSKHHCQSKGLLENAIPKKAKDHTLLITISHLQKIFYILSLGPRTLPQSNFSNTARQFHLHHLTTP